MPKPSFASLILLSLVACGDSDAPGRDPDGPPDEPPDDSPVAITVTTTRAPSLIAYRDGDGAWQTPPAGPTGAYTLAVTGPYRVVVACSNLGAMTTYELARTPDDAHELALSCDEAQIPSATVRGTMLQPGGAAVGTAYDYSDQPGWQLALPVVPGTYDLIAFTEERVVVRRDVPIITTEIEPIDVSTGAELVPVALKVTNATDEEFLEALVVLSTPTTRTFEISNDPNATHFAPSELGLEQHVAMTAWGDIGWRHVRRPFSAGMATEFTLPDPLGLVTFEADGALLTTNWTSLPELDNLHITAFGGDAQDQPSEYRLVLSSSYLAATGATRATFASDVPGYEPGWRPNLSRNYIRDIAARRTVGADEHLSMESHLVWFPAGSSTPVTTPRDPAAARRGLRR